jgi:FHS family glucose/mannose:H+ symporter-like MFS transporter
MFIAHAGFVLTGVVNTLLGPILPIVIVRWSLSDAQAGLLFTAQFVGAMAGTVGSSALMARLGCRRTAMAGLALMALGVAGTSSHSATVGVSAILCFGLGLGLDVPATNLWVALAELEGSAAALNLLNASWCIGAVAAAPLIIFSSDRIGLGWTLGALAILLSVLAIGGFMGADSTRLAAEGAAIAPKVDVAATGAEPGAAFLLDSPAARLSFVVCISALLFFYVGSEAGVGGWAATYAKRFALLPAVHIGLAQSIFYLMLMVGRLLAPVVLRRVRGTTLVTAGIWAAGTGVVLTVARPSSVPALAGFALTGLGFAVVFPITISYYSDLLGGEATRFAAWIFACGDFGAAILPPITGVISDRFQSLRAGMAFPLVSVAIMLILQARLRRMVYRDGTANRV